MQHRTYARFFLASEVVILYRVQPIRPRTTSDSSRNIFGHALARRR